MESEQFYFEGDGVIPNSKFPVVVYRQVAEKPSDELAKWFVQVFAKNKWSNSWRDGVFSYLHYHSNTHEVLGVTLGMANLKFGGSNGLSLHVSVGDVIVIPAGVAHERISHTNDFEVVGAYPNGQTPDLIKEERDKYYSSLKEIEQVPIPQFDPIFGSYQGVPIDWNAKPIAVS